jgi:hypothetical protein
LPLCPIIVSSSAQPSSGTASDDDGGRFERHAYWLFTDDFQRLDPAREIVWKVKWHDFSAPGSIQFGCWKDAFGDGGHLWTPLRANDRNQSAIGRDSLFQNLFLVEH